MIGHYLTHSTRRLSYGICMLSLALLIGCSDPHRESATTESDLPVYQQWHSVTLDFAGPDTSEQDADNPFLNYRLMVTFTHDGQEYPIRGYYAADGQASESGADAGNIWQVKFRAPETGQWQYRARLERGEKIALGADSGESLPLDNATGTFMVEASDKRAPDFRALGRLSVNDGYFYFPGTDRYWLKGGSNSPENFLAYEGFDGTYRIAASARDGEASANSELHQYESHRQDWQPGDPTLRGEAGKSIFGAVNYLAEKGMNAIYLLTLNIEGDGKDVWPYTSPEDFTRFDVSRLAQWEQLFQHMQNKGILIHMVTQETENERLLDDGDVGPMRTLYYQELIARFGHHLGLIWNLGEENGYAEWSPPAQNTEQRKAMIRFFEQADPYQNPVLLHTHAEIGTREPVLEPLLGVEGLDGLSLQADDREHAHEVVMKWKQRSEQAGRGWLITMDEIGMWHTGADTDANDPGHPSLRGDVLWGTLLSGAAGVEWYFGAHNPHNDLTSEDWRQREELWSLTRHAMTFFQTYLPWWDMAPAHDLLAREGAFCLAKHDDIYALYFPTGTEQYQIDLRGLSNDFEVHWYNPVSGGDLSSGSVTNVQGGAEVSLGNPPSRPTEDWVVLLRKTGR
ncbi:DUF5060 domain-containing protein [Marinimicrobium sp. LS-A18]|uniref:DUF5060 domain-containing protein n=1 Tax=Marinimicrobium sp. LS-A18 TaxID=1381596 RepID=UPI0004675346|nr:DUF5060 domain-containing protein [Marinimicrobium sp. LS-A18]